MLMDAADIATCAERNKYVVLLLDEMHVKEDIVYDKHSGEMIGFVNLDDINERLDAYERALNSDDDQQPTLYSIYAYSTYGMLTPHNRGQGAHFPR